MEEQLKTLLAAFRAARMLHHTAHWLAKGPNFYSDHKLFEELYTKLDGEIDKLAEKMVRMFGDDIVDPIEQIEMQMRMLHKWMGSEHIIDRSATAERFIQLSALKAQSMLDKEEPYPLGLDNFLAQVADDHDGSAYFLERRAMPDSET